MSLGTSTVLTAAMGSPAELVERNRSCHTSESKKPGGGGIIRLEMMSPGFVASRSGTGA